MSKRGTLQSSTPLSTPKAAMTYTDFSAQLSSVVFCIDFFEADRIWKSAIAQGRTIYLFIDGQYMGNTKPLDALLELWLGGAIV